MRGSLIGDVEETLPQIECRRVLAICSHPNQAEVRPRFHEEMLNKGRAYAGAPRIALDIKMPKPANGMICRIGIAIQATEALQVAFNECAEKAFSGQIKSVESSGPIVDEPIDKPEPFFARLGA